MRMKLSHDVVRSIAGAVQIYLDSCRAGILRQNNRSVEDALAMLNVTDVVDIFDIQDEIGNQTIAMLESRCPLCRNETDSRECCGNGRCENSVCMCEPGWFQGFHSFVKVLEFFVSFSRPGNSLKEPRSFRVLEFRNFVLRNS